MDTSRIVTPSVARVPLHTDAAVNQHLRDEAQRHIAYYRAHRDEIGQRIEELNEEWDVARALATGSSCLSLAGMALGLSGRRRTLLLAVAVQSFHLQHSIRGWCPPLPLLRRLGVRTPMEIEHERTALKELCEDVTENPAPAGGCGTPPRAAAIH